MSQLFEPVSFTRGKAMPNRFMLAPLTNSQSHEDGTLSDAEYQWLSMRAEGGFGCTMTCAAHVQAIGKGFPGQLGIFSDDHLPRLRQLANKINSCNSVSIVQLHHAGNRSPKDVIGTDPVCPSDDPKSGARALSTAEVEQLTEDFIAAAQRAEAAGFDGVELHGAHGYLLCQFLSPETNQRTDQYGGPLANRARIVFAILEGIRARCSPTFTVGIRLSPERFGMQLMEVRTLAQQLIDSGTIDFLDMSLWDCFKAPNEPEHQGRSLLSYFTDLERKGVKIGCAGKLHDPADAERVLAEGADFVVLGRVAILHHNYPQLLRANQAFVPKRPPVTADWLRQEGLGEAFIRYMSGWPGFVEEAQPQSAAAN